MKVLRQLHVLALLAMAAVCTAAAPVDEIEGLLSFVGHMKGAAFLRNGSEHTPTEAEAHLRQKWTSQKAQISTAEDFIRLCASKSSMSGKPYSIRFADGHEEPSAQVLLKQLADAREANRSGPPSAPAAPTTPAHSR